MGKGGSGERRGVLTVGPAVLADRQLWRERAPEAARIFDALSPASFEGRLGRLLTLEHVASRASRSGVRVRGLFFSTLEAALAERLSGDAVINRDRKPTYTLFDLGSDPLTALKPLYTDAPSAGLPGTTLSVTHESLWIGVRYVGKEVKSLVSKCSACGSWVQPDHGDIKTGFGHTVSDHAYDAGCGMVNESVDACANCPVAVPCGPVELQEYSKVDLLTPTF